VREEAAGRTNKLIWRVREWFAFLIEHSDGVFWVIMVAFVLGLHRIAICFVFFENYL